MKFFRERTGDLLVMDITQGDGWDKLCPFLKKIIPDAHFPQKNVKKNKDKVSLKDKFRNRLLSAKTGLNTGIDNQRVCIILLGQDSNLANLIASLLNLHPSCQVLHHASDRILGMPALDIFLKYSPKIFQHFSQFLIKESKYGDISPYSGFENTIVQEIYLKRYGRNPVIKKRIDALIWNDPRAIWQYIRQTNIDLHNLIENNDQICFLRPKVSSFPDTKSSEERWLTNMEQLYPSRFFGFFASQFGKDLLEKLASFLDLSYDKSWIKDTLLCKPLLPLE